MDIKEFIKSTVTQISEAVTELNSELCKDKEGTIINPYNVRHANRPASNTGGANITDIVFDLYVSVESGTESGGKIGIFSSIIGVGMEGKSDDSNKQVSRIQFTIPVLLPFERTLH
jgi:hypothetical protein